MVCATERGDRRRETWDRNDVERFTTLTTKEHDARGLARRRFCLLVCAKKQKNSERLRRESAFEKRRAARALAHRTLSTHTPTLAGALEVSLERRSQAERAADGAQRGRPVSDDGVRAKHLQGEESLQNDDAPGARGFLSLSLSRSRTEDGATFSTSARVC